MKNSNKENDRLIKQLISTTAERALLNGDYDVEKNVFDINTDPYNHMIKLIFCKWKPFILRAIAIDNGTYFSRFFKQLPISQKVLSQNLKEMVSDELIEREVIPEVPPRVVYHLTPTGKTLIGLLDMIYDWGWNDMKRKGLPIDILGEMWHGYREPDKELMDQPFSEEKKI